MMPLQHWFSERLELSMPTTACMSVTEEQTLLADMAQSCKSAPLWQSFLRIVRFGVAHEREVRV